MRFATIAFRIAGMPGREFAMTVPVDACVTRDRPRASRRAGATSRDAARSGAVTSRARRRPEEVRP